MKPEKQTWKKVDQHLQGEHPMFQRILVPLDGSSRAEQALPLAAHLAQWYHSSIVLLRSVELMTIYSMQTLGMMEKIQMMEEQAARNYLDQIKDSTVLEQIPISTELYVGNAASAILEVTARQNIDLIVLCSHGYTGFKHWMLGSVAQKIARSSPVPVLLQRDEHPLSFGSPTQEHPTFHTCVALDGSPQAEAAIPPAMAITATCTPPQQGEVHLLRIVEPLQAVDEEAFKELYDIDLQDSINRQAQTYLQEVATRLEPEATRQGIKITGTVRTSADIAQEVIQYAEKGTSIHHSPSQLLALTTQGRSGLERWVLGSIAERVLHQTRLPLLIAHPHTQAELKAKKQT
jgi:nucleotide-binding universal stress UspA family protein